MKRRRSSVANAKHRKSVVAGGGNDSGVAVVARAESTGGGRSSSAQEGSPPSRKQSASGGPADPAPPGDAVAGGSVGVARTASLRRLSTKRLGSLRRTSQRRGTGTATAAAAAAADASAAPASSLPELRVETPAPAPAGEARDGSRSQSRTDLSAPASAAVSHRGSMQVPRGDGTEPDAPDASLSASNGDASTAVVDAGAPHGEQLADSSAAADAGLLAAGSSSVVSLPPIGSARPSADAAPVPSSGGGAPAAVPSLPMQLPPLVAAAVPVVVAATPAPVAAAAAPPAPAPVASTVDPAVDALRSHLAAFLSAATARDVKRMRVATARLESTRAVSSLLGPAGVASLVQLQGEFCEWFALQAAMARSDSPSQGGAIFFSSAGGADSGAADTGGRGTLRGRVVHLRRELRNLQYAFAKRPKGRSTGAVLDDESFVVLATRLADLEKRQGTLQLRCKHVISERRAINHRLMAMLVAPAAPTEAVAVSPPTSPPDAHHHLAQALPPLSPLDAHLRAQSPSLRAQMPRIALGSHPHLLPTPPTQRPAAA